MQSTVIRSLMLAALLAALSPLPSPAQTQPVGVVTTLTGQASLARPAIPEPLILKFKDDVFERDRISTAEKSIVRVLLGGKAIVTVRELSVLTITEEPGRATIDLASGKIGVAVAKQRMRPGETLEIRTPNTVAAVRGTVLAVETNRVGPSQVTDYDLSRGNIDLLFPRPEALTANTGITVTGLFAPPPRPADQTRLGEVLKPGEPGVGSASTAPAREGSISSGLDQAGALALAISPSPPPLGVATASSGGTVPPPPNTTTTGLTLQDINNTCPQSTSCPGSGAAPIGLPGGTPPGGTPPGGGNGGPKTDGAEKIVNGGFETGSLAPGWSGTGAVSVITNLGSVTAPEGQRMAIIHTGAGSVLANLLPSPLNLPANRPPNATQGSVLSQSFAVEANTLYTIMVKYNFFSNEFPTFFAGGQSGVNDTLRGRLTPPPGSGSTIQLFQESLNTSFIPGVTVSPQTATAGGFTIFQNNGVTGFKSLNTPWTPLTSGQATLSFDIFDVGDTVVDSGALIDAVSVAQDPPLYFLLAGDRLTRTQREPLLSLTGTPQTFDSLMAVCCGGQASLAGPLLHTTNSDLTVLFSLVSVFQGGTLTTSSTEPLARLDGGAHNFGSIGLPMFYLSGMRAAADPESGLTLGTDQPLQHAGSLLETSGASVTAHQAIRLDTALLEATAPLLALRNKSQFTSTADAVELSYQAKVTSLGSLVRLDASTLTVASGAALNVAGGSVMRVTGDLFSLSNGSSLRLLNGPLLSLSGSSMLSVTGALVAFGGSGGNTLSVSNSLCPCTSIAGLPVSLTGGALASNISITGAIKNPTLGSINLSSPNAALIQVNGAGTKLTINGL